MSRLLKKVISRQGCSYLSLSCSATISQNRPHTLAVGFFRSQPFIKCISSVRPRRALLYVPGNDAKKVAKIPTLGADWAVLDCEDGVALNKKTEAREVIRKMLSELNFGRTERSVRINAIDSGLAEDDLRAVFDTSIPPESIVVPKVDSELHVEWVSDKLSQLAGTGAKKSAVQVILMIESGRALLDLDRICSHAHKQFAKTSHTLVGVVFGSDDFCADIGATRSKDAKELTYARQHFVVVAKAHRLQAIDMVYIDYKDLEGLRQHCLEGAQMGFTGKQVIHPGQVPVVQTAFRPSPEKVEWAQQLISAFEEHQKLGKGAFTFRGSMIDMPSVLQARNVVQLVEAIGNDLEITLSLVAQLVYIDEQLAS